MCLVPFQCAAKVTGLELEECSGAENDWAELKNASKEYDAP